MPASPQRHGEVPQRPLHRGPGRGDRHLPGRADRAHRPRPRGGGRASFRPWCGTCPLRPDCTASRRGRTIAIHPHEAVLQRARAAQRDPAWQQRYKADRPIVERKVSHFTRRAWGGRKARTRGLSRITTDLLTRAGALNWARLAALGLDHDQTGWALRAT
jgi:Transposase DDE domain